MIALVSSNPRERNAFAALCAARGWPYSECDSLRVLRKTLWQARPSVILIRHKLEDGYADELLQSFVHEPAALPRVLVLLEANASTAQEARHVSLGAEHVYRDPIRADVIVAYLARYRESRPETAISPASAAPATIHFARAVVRPLERILEYRGDQQPITPREIDLMTRLAAAPNQVLTYPILYSEVLGRPYHGETSNMRVLLGKLTASFSAVGLDLRQHVDVIPKVGYRYNS